MIGDLSRVERGELVRASRPQLAIAVPDGRETNERYNDDYDCEAFLALDHYLRQPAGTPASAKLAALLAKGNRR